MQDRFFFRVWYEGRYTYNAQVDQLFPFYLKNDCVEQCTGLKDKNGKLIYEGDLVNLGGYGVCQVIWSYDTAEFMFKNLNEDLSEHVDTMLLCDWEVIGNIHEKRIDDTALKKLF